jgi:hypothetical protein
MISYCVYGLTFSLAPTRDQTKRSYQHDFGYLGLFLP